MPLLAHRAINEDTSSRQSLYKTQGLPALKGYSHKFHRTSFDRHRKVRSRPLIPISSHCQWGVAVTQWSERNVKTFSPHFHLTRAEWSDRAALHVDYCCCLCMQLKLHDNAAAAGRIFVIYPNCCRRRHDFTGHLVRRATVAPWWQTINYAAGDVLPCQRR